MIKRYIRNDSKPDNSGLINTNLSMFVKIDFKIYFPGCKPRQLTELCYVAETHDVGQTK